MKKSKPRAKSSAKSTAPKDAIALLKAALTDGATTMDAALRTEIDYQPVLRQSRDHQAACRAFVDKSKPVFTGQ